MEEEESIKWPFSRIESSGLSVSTGFISIHGFNKRCMKAIMFSQKRFEPPHWETQWCCWCTTMPNKPARRHTSFHANRMSPCLSRTKFSQLMTHQVECCWRCRWREAINCVLWPGRWIASSVPFWGSPQNVNFAQQAMVQSRSALGPEHVSCIGPMLCHKALSCQHKTHYVKTAALTQLCQTKRVVSHSCIGRVWAAQGLFLGRGWNSAEEGSLFSMIFFFCFL